MVPSCFIGTNLWTHLWTHSWTHVWTRVAAFADILALQNTMLRGVFSGWLEIQRLLLLWQIWREDVVLSGVYS